MSLIECASGKKKRPFFLPAKKSNQRIDVYRSVMIDRVYAPCVRTDRPAGRDVLNTRRPSEWDQWRVREREREERERESERVGERERRGDKISPRTAATLNVNKALKFAGVAGLCFVPHEALSVGWSLLWVYIRTQMSPLFTGGHEQ